MMARASAQTQPRSAHRLGDTRATVRLSWPRALIDVAMPMAERRLGPRRSFLTTSLDRYGDLAPLLDVHSVSEKLPNSESL